MTARGTTTLPSRHAGFTLLEMLVAVTIFVFVAAMAYGGLASVVHQREATDIQMKRLRELQQGVTILTRDLAQIVHRPTRSALQDQSLPALRGSERDLPTLVFTRGGWRNPLGRPRSTLERVGYRIQDDELVRLVWPVLDQARVTNPLEQPLIKHVTRLTVRFLDGQGQWQDQWPPLNQDANAYIDVLPKGIEVAIDVKDVGRITRVVGLTP